MGQLTDILNYFGVNKVVAGWLVLLLLTGTTASSVTIFMTDFKKSMEKIDKLNDSVERIEDKLRLYSYETNDNLVMVEGAIIDLSILHERVNKDQYELLEEFIDHNEKLRILYNQKLIRLDELQKDHLPTRNSFKIGVRPKSE